MNKQLLSVIVLLLFANFVYACPGTHTSPSPAGDISVPISTPSPTICITQAGCGVTLATSTITDQGAAPATSAFSASVCTDSFSFPDFNIPWHSTHSDVEIRDVAVTTGGVYTAGIVTGTGSGDDDLIIEKLNKATGARLWGRTVDTAGVQANPHISVDEAAGRVVVTVDDLASADTDLLLYSVSTSTGADICTKRMGGDSGEDVLQSELYTGVAPGNTFIAGRVDEDALALSLDATATCSLISNLELTSLISGTERFNSVDLLPSGDPVFVGMVQSGTGGQAIELGLTAGFAFSHITGFDIGSTTGDDEFYSVETEDTSGDIIIGGKGADTAVICARDSTGAALWADDCKMISPGSPGQTNQVIIQDASSYAGGTITSNAYMAKLAESTGVVAWAKKNTGLNFGPDKVNSVAFGFNRVIGVGQIDGTNWAAFFRHPDNGQILAIDSFDDSGTEIAYAAVGDGDKVFAGGHGTDDVLEYTASSPAAPEFSSITLLLAALVSLGGIFIFRQRQ